MDPLRCEEPLEYVVVASLVADEEEWLNRLTTQKQQLDAQITILDEQVAR